MSTAPLRAAVVAALTLALLPSTGLAAPGWTEPVALSPTPTAHGGAWNYDQGADAAGNVTVAYAGCGIPVPADGFTDHGCALMVTHRDAATGDWTEPDQITGPYTGETAPTAIDVEVNGAGDVLIGWQACGYGSSHCTPRMALRPAGGEAFTAPVLPAGSTDHGDHVDQHVGFDVALGADGTALAAFSVRHGLGYTTAGELRVREATVVDPAVATPELAFSGPATTVSATDIWAPNAPVIAVAENGLVTAAWRQDRTCAATGAQFTTIAYAVRQPGQPWSDAEGVDGLDCETAPRLDNPEVAAYGAQSDVVLAWAAYAADNEAISGTNVASIDGDGVLEQRARLTPQLMGLSSDPTSSSRDETRAQFARNASGVIAMAAYEASPVTSENRPLLALRDAAGAWTTHPVSDDWENYNGVLAPAPGVALDGAGTATVVWSADASPEGQFPGTYRRIYAAELPAGASAFSTPLALSAADGVASRPLASNGPAGQPIVTWRRVHAPTNREIIETTEPTTAPEASFTWAPELPVAGQPVTFTATSTDPDDDPATLTHAWDFDADGDFSDGSGATAVASFDAPGDYDVTLRASDGDEQVDYALRVVVVDVAPPSQGPTADFGWTPQSPKTGESVTFSSFSTDGDAAIETLAWDLDGDGAFDDATGMHVERSFTTAGPQLVGLRATDADGDSNEKTAMVIVQARGSDPADGGGSGGGSGGGGDTGGGEQQPPATPAPQPMTLPAPMPGGFVVRSTIDTNGSRPMPAVTGRALDDARDAVAKALVYADVKTVRSATDAAKLGKRPGGGKWKVGDVIAQSPAAGTRAPGSSAAPTAVTLTFWAGAKSSKKKCDELRSTIKGDELDLALAQLKAAGCGTPDVKVKASKGAADPTVKSLSKDKDDLTVNVPTDQAKLDIVIWKNTGFLGTNDPGPVPSSNGDLQLTAGQRNVAGVILKDRAGRALNRASVTWDLSGAGGGEVTSKSIESGVAPVKLTPEKAGVVRVLVQWSDASGDSIYGYTEFKVVDRAREPGFVTAIGQSFKRSGSGKSAVFKPGSFKGGKAQRAGIGDFFNVVAQVIRSWGGPIASAVNSTAEGILGVSKTFQTSVAQLWRGPVNGPPTAAQSTFTTAGMWFVWPNGVVSAGGANVVAAGGMNVISAGGANVVAAGGMNVISAGGANVVSAGGGNLITLPDGARVVSAGGANVVAAGGMNVIAAGGGN